MSESSLLASWVQRSHRLDDDEEEVDDFAKHLRLIDMSDHLAEQSHALVKGGG